MIKIEYSAKHQDSLNCNIFLSASVLITQVPEWRRVGGGGEDMGCEGGTVLKEEKHKGTIEGSDNTRQQFDTHNGLVRQDWEHRNPQSLSLKASWILYQTLNINILTIIQGYEIKTYEPSTA